MNETNTKDKIITGIVLSPEEVIDFEEILMKNMGIKRGSESYSEEENKRLHALQNEWVGGKATKVREIINNKDNETLRILIKNKQYEEASKVEIEILEKEKVAA